MISTHVVVELRFWFAIKFRIRIVAIDDVLHKVVYSEDAEDARGMLQVYKVSLACRSMRTSGETYGVVGVRQSPYSDLCAIYVL